MRGSFKLRFDRCTSTSTDHKNSSVFAQLYPPRLEVTSCVLCLNPLYASTKTTTFLRYQELLHVFQHSVFYYFSDAVDACTIYILTREEFFHLIFFPIFPGVPARFSIPLRNGLTLFASTAS